MLNLYISALFKNPGFFPFLKMAQTLQYASTATSRSLNISVDTTITNGSNPNDQQKVTPTNPAATKFQNVTTPKIQNHQHQQQQTTVRPDVAGLIGSGSTNDTSKSGGDVEWTSFAHESGTDDTPESRFIQEGLL